MNSTGYAVSALGAVAMTVLMFLLCMTKGDLIGGLCLSIICLVGAAILTLMAEKASESEARANRHFKNLR